MSSSSDGSAAGPQISTSTTSTSTVTTVSALTSTPSTISAETQATTTTIPTPSSVSPVVANVSLWKCVSCQKELPVTVKLEYCPFRRCDQDLGAQVDVAPQNVSVSAPEPVVVTTTSATVQPASSIPGPVQNISMSSSTKTCTVVAISGPSTIPKIVSTPASDTAQTVATGTASLPPSGATPPSENIPTLVSSVMPLTTYAPVSTQVSKTTLTSDSSVGPLLNTTIASFSTSPSAIQTSVTTTPRAATITSTSVSTTIPVTSVLPPVSPTPVSTIVSPTPVSAAPVKFSVPSSSQASQVGNGADMVFVFGNMNKKQKVDENNDKTLLSDLRGDNSAPAAASTRKRSRSDEEPSKLTRPKLSDSRETLGGKDFNMSNSGEERMDANGSTRKDRKGDTSGGASGNTRKDKNGDTSSDAGGSTKKDRNGDTSSDAGGSTKKDRNGDTSSDASGSTKKDRNGDTSSDAGGSTKKDRNGDTSSDAGGSTKKDRNGDTSSDAGGSTKKERKGDTSSDAGGSTRKNRIGDASGDSSGSSKLLKQVISFFARKKVLEEYKIYLYIDICDRLPENRPFAKKNENSFFSFSKPKIYQEVR